MIATRNRRPELLRTLGRLHELPERPPVIVVDNASADGSAAAVRDRSRPSRSRMLPLNAGAAARNIGAALAATPYVAFSDDDSWWEPGALARAATALDADPGSASSPPVRWSGRPANRIRSTRLMARSPLRDGRRGRGARLSGLRLRAAEGGVPARRRVQRAAVLHRRRAAAQLRPGRRGLGPALSPGSDRGARAVRDPAAPASAPPGRTPQPAAHRVAAPPGRGGAGARRCAWPGTPPRSRCPGSAGRGAARLPAALRSRRRLPADVERKVRLLAAAQGGSW